MDSNAECKVCNNGVLLPFYSPEGHVVYFCNNCRSRFSAYAEEPHLDGIPVFTDLAYYITETDVVGESLTAGKMMDEFKMILEENPPKPLPLEDGGCPYCAGPLDPEGKCQDLCYLPEV
jgi:hypothetical protein